MNMRLVYEKTGIEVQEGDKVETSRNEKVTVTSIEKPRHGGSTGRVYVEYENGSRGGYYPVVVGAHWIEREDQD
jgi:hypothetical protein